MYIFDYIKMICVGMVANGLSKQANVSDINSAHLNLCVI